jgi:hypothetical protein
MTNPTTPFSWQMPTSSDLVTDLPADFEVFGQAVATSMADLLGGTSGQILAKASNTDMDFTWVTNDVGDITGITATSPLTGGGTSGAVTVGIQSASTSQAGAVQLSDSTSTTSSVLAATPTAVKSAYDLAAGATTKATLTTKGDIYAASAASTPTRLGVGNDGETLVADSSTSTGLRYSAGNPIGNPILNSSFQCWQRGITGTANSFAAGAGYNADRWQNYYPGTLTVSRQATGDTTNLPNIQYCARVQRNAGQTNTGGLSFGQTVETMNTIPFVAKTVTYSYYARKGADYSATSNALAVICDTGTGTDQNVFTGFTGTTRPLNATITLTATWQRFTHTFTIANSATQMGFLFTETPTGTAGTNDYFEITGVQLDISSVALPFRTNQPTIATELAACQRYYFRSTPTTLYGWFGSGIALSTTQTHIGVPLPVSMRTTPSSVDFSLLSVSDSVTQTSVTSCAIQGNIIDNQFGVVTASVASGLTQYRPYYLQGFGSGAYIGFGAEL